MIGLHVVFRVAGTDYALPAESVLHMESYTGATTVPGAKPWVAGLVQVRGRVIPVVDLRARFGLPPIEASLDSRVIVVQDGDRTVGLLADSAREVLQLPPDAVKPTPGVIAHDASGFVDSIAQAGPRLVLLLSLPKVLGSELIDGIS